VIQINKIYNQENLETMKNIPDKFVSGIITSPPYNYCIKRKDCYYNNGYSDQDNLDQDEYLSIRIKEFKEFQRIIKKDGVICYNISYHNENPILPTLLMSELHKSTDLTIADIIVWKKSHSIPFQTSPNKLSRLCELVYVIVKKESLHTFQSNKEVSTINKKTNQKFYKNYTNLIEAKNNDGIKSKLKAAYSEELVSKLIKIYFKSGSLVYDPFSGLGTTARSCIKNDINYIGSEINEEIFLQSCSLINKS